MGVDYYSYIQSEEWRERADAAKRRAGYRCQVCNRPSRDVTLDAHHRTYDRLGNEAPEDITVLCRDCHELYETNRKIKNSAHKPLASVGSTGIGVQGNGGTFYKLVETTAEDDSSTEVYEDEEVYFDERKHFWIRLGKIVYGLGYVGNVLCLLWIEWAVILREPWQLLNPFLHIENFSRLIATSLFWQFVAITTAGIALTYLATWLTRRLMPRYSMLKWYWRWGAPALIRVPIFLIGTVVGILSTLNIVLLVLAYLSSGIGSPVSTNFYLLPLTILRSYILFLPVPAIHLVWDNDFRSNWGKLATSFCVFLLIAISSVIVDYFWGKQMCVMGFMHELQCTFYLR